MSAYTIRVIIEDSWGRAVAEACAPMERELHDAIQPIKLSDGPMAFLDTPKSIVKRIRADRQSYARILTPKIAKCLLDAMSAKDLFNGYTKEPSHGE